MATARRIQAGSYDTLGQAVYPASTPHAFALSFDAAGNLQIGSGRMYVDGLLVENHGTEPLVWDPALAESRGAPTPYLPSAPSVHGMPYMPNPPTLPRPGAPGYAQLAAFAGASLQTGADDEGQPGAFHSVYAPRRERNLQVRLAEYLRTSLEAGIFHAS